MKLTFTQNHLSVEAFQEVNADDFIVLTGVNGSGKSHLLDAIEQRKVFIDDSNVLRIVKFNFETFRLENESAYNGQQLAAERQNAWSFFENQIKPNAVSWKTNLGDGYRTAVDQCQLAKLPFIKASEPAIGGYKKTVDQFFNNPGIKGNPAAVGIYSMIQQLPYSIDEIKQEKFTSIFKPFTAKQDFLPMALGKIIWDYYLKYRNNQLNRFLNATDGKTIAVLTENEFIEAHGEKPWEIINSILKTFNSLEYRVNSPEGIEIFGDFVLKLVHTTKTGLEIDFSSLSSGERVLMALVASIYKSSSDNYFPDVLLLDELDASLHPSMMRNMLAVIRNVFLQRGVKVILVTHSPTTIALCPEESIYVMNRSGLNRIEKKSRGEALSILTEGFATLEKSLLLFDEVTKNQVSIITEGKNTVYLKKALAIAGLENDVSIVEGIESISGKSQLKTLFDFFSRVQHANKVLFVWDCDASFQLQDTNQTYPFIFAVNDENKLSKKGIENLFSETLFEGFLKTISPSQGNPIVEFDETRKRDFESHVLTLASPNEFRKFGPFIDKVRLLLNPVSNANTQT
jgi:predicted ATPase